jgi:Dyp-type peroxidase family
VTIRDLELADIQGNILRGYNQPCFRFLYFQVAEVSAGQAFLRALVPFVVTAQPWTNGKPSWTLNLAFTANGLRALGVSDVILNEFPLEFRQGMKARADVLVDRDESAPAHWESIWQDGQVHVLVSLSANSPAERDQRGAWVLDIAARTPAVTCVGTQDAGKLVIDGEYSPKEHFGYTDGIGNPDIEGVPGRHGNGGGKMQGDRWVPLAPGEFLLGYRDEAGEVAPTPLPRRLFRNGTFMVFRKLEQRVAAFREFVEREGAAYPGGPDLFRAKLVGRWPDGTPLMLSPHEPDPAIVSDPSRNLDFRYGDDPLGKRCPIGAHIRRANPRDAIGFNGRLSDRHRIIRRGVMYGSWLPPDADATADTNERGILFIAFNANLERQFEFVQQQWMNFGNDFLLGNDTDPLIGTRPPGNKLVVQGDVSGPPPWIVADLPTFVVTRGGDYFFTPSLSGCRLLANAEADLDPTAIPDPEPAPPPAHKPSRLEALGEAMRDLLLALPGGDAIDHALQHLGDDLESFGEKAKAWALHQNPEPVFAVLRRVKPVLVLESMVVITKCDDAQQVLSYPTLFTVPYAAKFAELCDGGGFMLGWDDTPEYTRDLSSMRLVIRREDLPTRIAPLVSRIAAERVAASAGRLDVVADLGSVVPTEFVRDYMMPLVGEDATLASQTAAISAYLFLPVGDFRDAALGGAESMRGAMAATIAARKQARGQIDDVLERCLVLQDAGVGGLDDAGILNNLFGMVVGAIPTTSAAVARAIDELLRRPEELAAAQAAARDGDIELVTRYVFEALRFNPIGPGVFRIAQQDFIVAGGTSRETMIPAGRQVMVALQSASFDADRVPSPSTFSIHRPLPEYLHFGFGLHTCFGRYINAVQIPRIVAEVLKQPNLRRAAGAEGTLQVDGPFPTRLVVEFDREG